ncbi:D-lactaldehyde dehydrogenase [Mrakia frigida]|uniref:SDR family oxidoreductase n=1 Tax=Mrakia frigida TaxID=29902 RepID=UPI003FCC0B09
MPNSSTPQLPSPGSKILLTGASGFIAVHVAAQLLKDRFSVVGSVRTVAKGDYLKNLFKGKPFSYVIVEDIGKPDAFDEAVKGVEGVVHTASPFHWNAASLEELTDPAINGTVGILKSVAKNGSSVRRVVITSSCASVEGPFSGRPPPYTLTEDDWNLTSVPMCERDGDQANKIVMYCASKVLAERAAWKFMEDTKPAFDLTVINPPFVFGPILHQVETEESLNQSVGVFHSVVKGTKTEEDLPGPMGSWVDVRDVAFVHSKSLLVPEAGNQRFIVSAGEFCVQDWTDFLHANHPSVPNIPQGQPGGGEEVCDPAKVAHSSGDKAARVLGVQYISKETCWTDMYDSIKAKGF